MSGVSDFDFYRGTKDVNSRLAVPYGARLPSPFDASEWNIMYATPAEESVLGEVVADIQKRGFSFYQLAT